MPLISTEYLIKNNLVTKQTSGLNDTVIKRFSTIKPLPFEGELPPERIEINVTEPNKDVSVIEVINEKYYRIMSTRMGKFTVNFDIVEKISSGPSIRPTLYNRIVEEELLKTAINPQHRNILAELEEEKMHIIPVEVLKSGVIAEVTDGFIKMVKSSKLTEPSGIRKLLNSSEHIAIVSNAIIGSLSYHIAAENDELMLSFAAKSAKLVDEFVLQLKSRMGDFIAKNMRPMIFKELSRDNLEKFLIDGYRDVIRAITDELDPKKGSLWAAMEISLKEHAMKQKV